MGGALGNRRGFTLTEILVVVGILVLLTAIVLPNVTEALVKARMRRAESDIESMAVALASYHADFGTYPGDVFPTEDINNNGVLDDGEDVGVDVDRDRTNDYAIIANGRLDHGDGVVNIDDLEWALRTTAKNGPYMESIPLDPWGNRYVYCAPFERPMNTDDYLYIDPATMSGEDANLDGQLGGNKVPRDNSFTEDDGIGQYATTVDSSEIDGNFLNKWAGRDNGILDHGDDDNKNGTIEYYSVILASPAPQQQQQLELGNQDISPDGLARNLGYYIYSTGRNSRDESATGYEDIGGLNGKGLPDSRLNDQAVTDLRLYVESPPSAAARFDEDLDLDGTLDTGYEDTGIDGIPGTKDKGEDDWDTSGALNPTTTGGGGQPDEEFGTQTGGPVQYHYNKHHTHPDVQDDENPGFDIGGDDINSWNKAKPWESHNSYSG